jgi:hypothetical protein
MTRTEKIAACLLGLACYLVFDASVSTFITGEQDRGIAASISGLMIVGLVAMLFPGKTPKTPKRKGKA